MTVSTAKKFTEAEERQHPVLETARLNIRPIDPRHARLIADMGKDPDVVKTLIGDWSREENRQQLALQWLSDNQEYGIWGVFDRHGQFGVRGDFLGFFSTEHALPDVGIGLEVFYAFKRKCWGQGVASEAVQAIVRHLFTTVKIPALEAMVLPGINPASAKLLQGIGMKKIGRYPIAQYSGRYAQPTIDYEIWRVRNSLPEQALENLEQAAFKIGMYLGEGFGERRLIEAQLINTRNTIIGLIPREIRKWRETFASSIDAGMKESGWIYYRVTRQEYLLSNGSREFQSPDRIECEYFIEPDDLALL